MVMQLRNFASFVIIKTVQLGMTFLSFLRNIFFGTNSNEPKNGGSFDNSNELYTQYFRNPIWQNDEDDDDDVEDFRHFWGGTHFHIFNDPLEMSEQVELQINNLLRSCFGFHHEDPSALPFAAPPFAAPPVAAPPVAAPPVAAPYESLRDKMLKHGSKNFNGGMPEGDSDLDGNVTEDNFANLWKNYQQQKEFKTFVMQKKVFIHDSDGTIKQKEMFKDSVGNEKIIKSQQVGDKLRIITIKKDKDGKETKTEELVNIDENDLTKNRSLLRKDDSIPTMYLPLYFPWKYFFKPDPKL